MRRICFVGMILCLSFSDLVDAQEKLTFSTFDEPTPFTITAERILREAYTRLGIEIDIQHYPGERALYTANQGVVDGELVRVTNLHTTYPNLLMVPTSFMEIEIMAFTKQLSFPVEGWESLRPYTIAFLRGFKLAEAQTEEMRVYETANDELTFQLLEAERVQVALGTRLGGVFFIKRMKLDEIAPLEPPLATIPMYHYLHNKHERLVPQIDEVLQQLIQEGIHQQIRQAVINEYLE